MDSAIFSLRALAARRAGLGAPWLEFLRVPLMSAGIYELPAGGADPQKPHGADEVYVVTDGRATMNLDGERSPVGPGSIVYVRAGLPHRFEEIAADLRVIVIFSPAEP